MKTIPDPTTKDPSAPGPHSQVSPPTPVMHSSAGAYLLISPNKPRDANLYLTPGDKNPPKITLLYLCLCDSGSVDSRHCLDAMNSPGKLPTCVLLQYLILQGHTPGRGRLQKAQWMHPAPHIYLCWTPHISSDRPRRTSLSPTRIPHTFLRDSALSKQA